MKSETFSSRLHREPLWRSGRQTPVTAIPVWVRGWLLDAASLTHRVRQACPGPFRVKVLDQGHARAQPSEIAVLGMDRGEIALVRQVELLCEERPWVFARTVIPVPSLRGPLRHLARLGSRPLGAVLFADKTMRRGEVELARIEAGQGLFDAATRDLPEPPPEIWGRRSVFWVRGRPLLVNELFLPGIGACGDEGRKRRGPAPRNKPK